MCHVLFTNRGSAAIACGRWATVGYWLRIVHADSAAATALRLWCDRLASTAFYIVYFA